MIQKAITSAGGGGGTKSETLTQIIPQNTDTVIEVSGLSKIWGARVAYSGYVCDVFYDSVNDNYNIHNANTAYWQIKNVRDNKITFWQNWAANLTFDIIAVGD